MPQSIYTLDDLATWFDGPIADIQDNWLLPVRHRFFPGITMEELIASRRVLIREIPPELEQLLRLSNGAELFCLHYRPPVYEDYWLARYRILSAADLAQVNGDLFEVFQTYTEYDPKYVAFTQEDMDYLAFCEVGDGNYLAIVTSGDDRGIVFYLDHEYGFYPYQDRYAREAYAAVADSISDWLELLARTYGLQGIGPKFIPL